MVATYSSAAKPPTPAYAVFLHRSELKRKRMHFINVSQTKIDLTDQLIYKLKQRMGTCSYQDLQFMVREQDFRNYLHRQLMFRQMQMMKLQKNVPKG